MASTSRNLASAWLAAFVLLTFYLLHLHYYTPINLTWSLLDHASLSSSLLTLHSAIETGIFPFKYFSSCCLILSSDVSQFPECLAKQSKFPPRLIGSWGSSLRSAFQRVWLADSSTCHILNSWSGLSLANKSASNQAWTWWWHQMLDNFFISP